MAERVEIKLSVDGKTGTLRTAEQQIGKLGTSVERTGKQAKKAGGGFDELGASLKTVLAAGAIIQFFRTAITEASRLEDAVVKAAQAMASAGEFSQKAARDIQDFAVSMEETNNVARETVLEQFALARSFTATNEQAQELTAAAIDFGAAAKINLEEAIRRLGRATQGSAADVANFLPELRKLTKEQLAAGEATRLVAERFKGQAAAQTQTFGGSLQRLSLQFTRITRSVGQQLIPVVDSLGEVFQSNLGGLIRLASVITGTISAAITGLDLVLRTVVRVFRSSTNIVTTFAQQAKEVFSGNFQEAADLGNRLRGDLAKTAKGFVEDTRGSQDRLIKIFETTAKKIAGIDKGISDERLKNLKNRTQNAEAESAAQFEARKRGFDLELAELRAQAQERLNELNLSREERLTRINEAEAAERELLREAREQRFIDDEQFATKLVELERRTRGQRTAIAQEGVFDQAKALEAFVDDIEATDKKLFDLGTKTFKDIGDGVGKSLADMIVSGKDFEKGFTQIWRNIRTQVIAQITAMIIKLIALKAAKAALGGPLGALFAQGGRTPGLTAAPGGTPRALARGGRTSGPELALIGEGQDDESVVPDAKAPGFALGVLAGLNSKGGVRTSRPSTRSAPAASMPMSVQLQGDIVLNISQADFTDPENAREVLRQAVNLIENEAEEAIIFSRRSSDLNELNQDRAF